jgi:hypothetical protein
MKRTTTLIAALTGAAVLLAGCSSTSGTATVAVSSTSILPSSAASSSASSLAAPSSAPTPGSSDNSEPSVSESSVPGSAPDTTVGDASGGLDAQSADWFTAFCGGLAPALTASGSLTALGSGAASDPTAAVKKLVVVFGALGASMTKTAATLKDMSPPTFPGGKDFASKVVAAFAAEGPAITAAAKKIAADPSSLASSAGGLSDLMAKAVGPGEDLSALKLTAATQNAIKQLPACAKVMSLAGG